MLSTASRLKAGSIGSAKTASSDRASRSRGALRSTGVSFEPSGIQTLVTHGLPSASPMAAPMRRQAMPCSIQKSRIAASGCDSVRPSAALGWAKKVGLKSIPIRSLLAQSIQLRKCSGRSASRSTRRPPVSA